MEHRRGRQQVAVRPMVRAPSNPCDYITPSDDCHYLPVYLPHGSSCRSCSNKIYCQTCQAAHGRKTLPLVEYTPILIDETLLLNLPLRCSAFFVFLRVCAFFVLCFFTLMCVCVCGICCRVGNSWAAVTLVGSVRHSIKPVRTSGGQGSGCCCCAWRKEAG